MVVDSFSASAVYLCTHSLAWASERVDVGLKSGLAVVLGDLVGWDLRLFLPDLPTLTPAGDGWVAGGDRIGFGFLSWSVFELLKAKELTGIAARRFNGVGCCDAAVLLHD